MNSQKLILSFVAVLFIGVLLGGAFIYFTFSEDKTTAVVPASDYEKQLYSCGMHPNVISEEPGNCPICSMKLTPIKGGTVSQKSGSKEKGKILYWRAPMDATYISDQPGKSPMGMDLIPVYEGDEGGGTGSILIDPITVQNMGIKTTRVQRKDTNKAIRAVGTVTYNEEKLYTVNTKISGWIEKLYVNTTGQLVKKGEPLLEIYSPELVSAQEEYLLALKNKELVNKSSFQEIKNGAKSLLASTRKRLENWDIPTNAIDAIESRGVVTKTMTLTAPANGVVIHKNAVEGAHVKEGVNLYQIADLSTVWVEASIYEYEINWVKTGQNAEMELSYIPGKKFHGKVTYIYPYLDRKARNMKVRLEFPNPALALKPDMYANITLQTDTEKNALVIPNEAVIRSGVRNLVFVTREQGKFEPREVTIGTENDDGSVSVISGLLEGEQIVVSGQFLLDSESNAQEAIKKMLDAKNQKNSTETMTKTEDSHSHSQEKKDELGEHQMKEMSAEESHKGHQHEMEQQTNNEMETHQEHNHETGALYTCPMHPEFITNDPNQRCPVCEMKLDKKKDLAEGAKLYTCPMHAEFVTDAANAKCSICEMKLVEKNKHR